MIRTEDCFVVTPDNVEQYVRAANGGNTRARQVLDAINMWIVQLRENKDSVCGCQGCSRSTRAFVFADDLPQTFIVGITPDGSTGVISGVCERCAKRADMLDAACESMRETIASETSRGHTIH